MTEPFTKFICTECGHRDSPCMHWREREEEKRWKFVAAALGELLGGELNKKIQHILDIENTIRKEDQFILQRIDRLFDLLEPKLKEGSVNLMAKTIVVGGTSLATLKLVDTTGAPMTIDSTYKVAYAASNPASVSVGTVNPDGSATITGVAVDPGNQIGANVTRPDGVVINLTPDTLTITAARPVLASGAVVLT